MNKQFNLFCGDSYEVLKTLEDNSIDSIITDPPYGLTKQPDVKKVLTKWLNEEEYHTPEKGFNGCKWDSFVPSPILWKEVIRVLKPGGHILSFSGSRTQYLMSISMTLAGFEIRDQIVWCYSSGFPKSHNVANTIDKMNGAENRGGQICAVATHHRTTGEKLKPGSFLDKYKPRTEHSVGYEGMGTAIKPAIEPIVLARKPIEKKSTVVKNILKYGTGGFNIDDCRVEGNRFPSNFIVEEDEYNESILGDNMKYFYHPKANKKDKNEGLEEFEDKQKLFNGKSSSPSSEMKGVEKKFTTLPSKNNHPTVKPTDLMCYLIRLITPKNGVILDPFNGSGSTGKAAMRENRLNNSNFKYIGIDLDQDYIDISEARIKHEINKKD